MLGDKPGNGRAERLGQTAYLAVAAARQHNQRRPLDLGNRRPFSRAGLIWSSLWTSG